MKRYWFYIENYVHLNKVGPDKLLLFNTLDGSKLVCTNEQVYSFMVDLDSPDNKGVIEVNMDWLQQKNVEVYNFIQDIREKFMGDLLPIPLDENCKKPVLFRCEPTILREVGGSIEEKLGENILYNLTELTLYINEECQYPCDNCNAYYKQFPCCHKADRKTELSFELILKLLESIQETSLVKINITGGNIFVYTHFDELVEKLNSLPVKKEYKVNIKHLTDLKTLQKLVETPSNSVEIICSDLKDLEDTSLIKGLEGLSSLKFNVIVQSEDDVKDFENMLSASRQEIIFSPFYNGRNAKFFEENVFVREEDIESLTLKDIEIKRNYLLNDYFFGHLTCMPDGSVYSSLNDAPLGKITEESWAGLMLKELKSGKSWLRVRRNIPPCNECVFSCICPPVSNYEKVIGRNNLCTLR